MKKQIKWAIALKNIYDGNVECPFCKSKKLDYKFYADDDNIGSAFFECPDCGESGRGCRVAFPKNIKTMRFESLGA